MARYRSFSCSVFALVFACGQPTSSDLAAEQAADEALAAEETQGITWALGSSSWSSLTNMATARAQHAAALLPDGQVLVVSGVNRAGFVNAAERFDPSTGIWTSTPPPNIQGNVASAVLLPNGKVYVATDGGVANLYDHVTNSWSAAASPGSFSLATYTLLRNGQILIAGGSNSAAAFLYDPATNTVNATGSLSLMRRSGCAVLLRDGRVLALGGFNNTLSSISDASLYDPTPGTWSNAAQLLVARHYHSATLLPDGRVLAVGGTTADGETSMAELYDPAANTWTATGSLAFARSGHTATLLASGKVLVTGGSFNRAAVAQSELYDPATGTWSAASSLAVARENGTATLLPSGKVLFAGGFNSSGSLTFYASAELFDPNSGRFSNAGSMAEAGRSLVTARLATNKLLVLGNGASVELYDRASNSFTEAAELSHERTLTTATLLPSGKVLVAGGQNPDGSALAEAELYDPVADSWSTAGTLSVARFNHSATLLPSGKVVVAGGLVSGGAASAAIDVYDPTTNSWSTSTSLSTARGQHGAALLSDGKVLFAGGANGVTAGLASCEIWDPDSGQVSVTGSLASGRMQFTLLRLPSGKLLAAGGAASAPLATAERFDPATQQWEPAGLLAQARADAGAALLPSGVVLIAGGYVANNGQGTASTELYDPATNTWSSSANLQVARAAPGLSVLASGEVLVVGGATLTSGPSLASSELFDPGSAFPAWRPQLTGSTTLFAGCDNPLSGTGLRGVSGASAGSYLDSATNFPLLRLLSSSDGLWPMVGSDWSDNNVSVAIPRAMPEGAYALTVFTNAISNGRMVNVVRAPTPKAQSVQVPYDTPYAITLTTLEGGVQLPLAIATPPAHGTLGTLSGNRVTYTPEPGYLGSDSFTFGPRDCLAQIEPAAVTLSVGDFTPPIITCPADVSVRAANDAGMLVAYDPAQASDLAGTVVVTYSTPSGSTFPLGLTVVNAVAADAAGNTSSCSFAVDVRYDAPPMSDAGSDVEEEPSPSPVDAGSGPDAEPDAGVADEGGTLSGGGCGCATQGGTPRLDASMLLLLLGFVRRRARACRPRRSDR